MSIFDVTIKYIFQMMLLSSLVVLVLVAHLDGKPVGGEDLVRGPCNRVQSTLQALEGSMPHECQSTFFADRRISIGGTDLLEASNLLSHCVAGGDTLHCLDDAVFEHK